jgi:hypothetical protein
MGSASAGMKKTSNPTSAIADRHGTGEVAAKIQAHVVVAIGNVGITASGASGPATMSAVAPLPEAWRTSPPLPIAPDAASPRRVRLRISRATAPAPFALSASPPSPRPSRPSSVVRAPHPLSCRIRCIAVPAKHVLPRSGPQRIRNGAMATARMRGQRSHAFPSSVVVTCVPSCPRRRRPNGQPRFQH